MLITPLGGDLEKPLYMYQAHLYVNRSAFRRRGIVRPSDGCSVLMRLLLCSDVSRNSEISIQCYLRADEPKRGGDGLADDLGNDIFMGSLKFTPDFDNMGSEDTVSLSS